MIRTKRKFPVCLVLTATLLPAVAVGQGPGTANYWLPADGNYNDGSDASWSVGFVPSHEFDEAAVITTNGNATTPVARINTNLVTLPGAVYLGELAGESGSLVVESGGTLTTGFTAGNATLGGIDVGLGGVGYLDVLPGATLVAGYVTLGGEGGSLASFGGTTAGTTSVNLESAFGNDAGEFGTTVGAGNTLRLVGPNVDYSTLSFTMANGSTFAAGVTAASHSALKSINAVGISGTLRLEFDGVTPSVGDSWILFDAPGVNGAFDEIVATGAPDLPFGQLYVFDATADAGSTRGVYGRVSVEQQLVLKVNRATGAAAIQNGPTAVSFDGYSVSSELGAIKTSEWNSLDAQGVSDWRASPAEGAATRISELKPTGSTTVAAGPGYDLGTIFQYPTPTEFGTELEDLQFEYYTPDGDVVEAQIVYEGDKRYNNLVLVVDPDDGRAQLYNQSPFDISIDGYWIESESGSLQGDNANWDSLDDQGVEGGSWREANPTANNLVELQGVGATLLEAGATYNLGSLFDTAGDQDLTLRFLFPEDDAFGRVGAVAYRDIVGMLNGDYNDDGVVNAADYTVWRDNEGANVAPGSGADGNSDGIVDSADYDVWAFNYGAFLGGVGAAASFAVPEPGALVLASIAGIGVVMGRARRASR